MPYTALVGFVNALTSISLGTFVFCMNPRGKTHQAYFLFGLSVGLYSVGYFLWGMASSTGQAMLAFKVLTSGIILTNSFYLEFIFNFLEERKNKRFAMLAIHAMNVLFVWLTWNEYLFAQVNRKNIWGYWPVPTRLFYFYFFSWVFQFLYGVFALQKGCAVAVGRKGTQLKYILISTLIGYLGGGTNWLPWFNINFPPYLNAFVTVYVGILAYAIVRYRLMDIEIIIKKTLVFAGLVTFVFTIFTVATIFVQKFLNLYLKAGDFWSYAISIFLIVLGYDSIRNFLVNFTDNYLFQKKYDYQKLLKDATRGITKIESLEHLLKLVTHFVTMKMRLKNAAILMRERHANVFVMHNQRGYGKNYLDYRIDLLEPLLTYLEHVKESVDLERLKEQISQAQQKKKVNEAAEERSFDLEAIKEKMEELKAVCCVPSFLGHELRSVLILGEKKSGDYYTDDDLNVLFTLAQESAIAIENARLFDEAIRKTHELEKINEQLEYSKSLLIRALKETEVANKQLQDTQAQLIHEQKMATLGRLAASVGHEVNNPLTILSMNVSRAILKYRKNPDMKVGEILELFDKMEQNIGRIKAVVNTLTGLLKRSEKGKFEPLSLKLILEETLPLVQFQTYLDNLTGTEVEFDVPGNTPLVIGDLERLQEVFLNLFINAYHAMEGRRNRKIKVTAEIDPANARQLAVHFTDNGSGMTEEIMKKIFNYAFTTKGPGKGSGMGLYMCKYIIELHGGEIRVASKVGEGTTFTLTLPIHEEATSSSDEGKVEASS